MKDAWEFDIGAVGWRGHSISRQKGQPERKHREMNEMKKIKMKKVSQSHGGQGRVALGSGCDGTKTRKLR